MDDTELAGIDPHDLVDAEAARIDAFLTSLPADASDGAWTRPSRCAGWTVRDVLGHLAANEEYHEACVEGDVGSYLQTMGEKGAVDLASANALGVAERAGVEPAELIRSWR